jgi:hypothetical protein
MACDRCHWPLFRGLPACLRCKRPAKMPGPRSRYPWVHWVDGKHILEIVAWLVGAVVLLKVMTMVSACTNEQYQSQPEQNSTSANPPS